LKGKKLVLLLNENLPSGVMANTAAILGISLGRRFPEAVGEDVTDGSGFSHEGIVKIPVPVLKGSEEKLKELRGMLYREDYDDLTVVDFSDVARGCRTYGEYVEKSASTEESCYVYLGLAICGDAKKVNSLTGAMPLLR
jgi:hypothetical protein